MHFLAKSPGHSFDFHAMNMSHAVHHYYFGARLPLLLNRVITGCEYSAVQSSDKRCLCYVTLHFQHVVIVNVHSTTA